MSKRWVFLFLFVIGAVLISSVRWEVENRPSPVDESRLTAISRPPSGNFPEPDFTERTRPALATFGEEGFFVLPPPSLDTGSRRSNTVPSPFLGRVPAEIRAIYLTSWSAGNEGKIKQLLRLAGGQIINAVVIDIKDYSGVLAYQSSVPEVGISGASSSRIDDPEALIRRLHGAGLYLIGRITVFQDPVLARARPELAVQTAEGGIWFDAKGLAWLDPASREVWHYNIEIAREAASLGFDELNFDYVRFPSDGDLGAATYPIWRPEEKNRSATLQEFFAELRRALPNVFLSVDFFGLTTVNNDDLGVGQRIEDAFSYFDVVAPMVYPSHYASGFLGFENPAAHPREVVAYSMTSALLRLLRQKLGEMQAGGSPRPVVLRPWLQDFDLGADYDAAMVAAQIKGLKEALGDYYGGFMLWNPSNFYNVDAIMAASS